MSLLFLSFIVSIFSRNVLFVSLIFLKRFLVFLILLFCLVLFFALFSISLHCSLTKALLSLLAILWISAFNWVYLSLSSLPSLIFFSQIFLKPPQTTTLPSWMYFSLGWFWSLDPIQFYKCPSMHDCSFDISNFLEEISSLSHSIVFLYFFALFIYEGLISPCFPLEICIQLGISFPFSFAFHCLLSSAIHKASSDNHFAFLHFFFLEMVMVTTSCTMLQTPIHSSSGTLSDLIPWIYFSLPLYNCKGFDLGHTWVI